MKLFSLIILFFALLSSVESQKGRARRKAATRKSSSAGDGFNMPRDKTRERKKYGTINVNMGKGKSN